MKRWQARKGVRQALWFVGIWCASVAALAAVAYGLRLVVR